MMVNSAESPAVRLARRLRSLRTEGFSGRGLTQGQLAEALGTSVPLISSWESASNPKPPPRARLDAYATFFATERSVALSPYRVLPNSQLTSEEQARRDELFEELASLRVEAQGHEHGSSDDPFAGSHFRFPPEEGITIVCSALPPSYLEPIAYADQNAPDYVELYKYADLDALLELFGHLRAANPMSDVRIRTPAEVREDGDATHLVLLGGVDWNTTTAELLDSLEVPVRQLARETEAEPGGFLIGEGENQRMFEPKLRKVGEDEILVEDVALFFRGRSPFNGRRTVTICNGMYARGTYGAVRALTDARFRDRNENYLRTRFVNKSTFSIISRVKVFLGAVVTPDWSSTEDLLHEWPVP